MSRVMLSARVTKAQADALRQFADEAGLPLYQATVRALERGIEALTENKTETTSPPSEPVNLDRIEEGIGILQAHVERIEALNDRSLFAAGAAYAATVIAAKTGMSADERKQFDKAIATEANKIHKRQLDKARGTDP